MRTLPIYHAYGSLGQIPELHDGRSTKVAFGSESLSLLSASDGIKTFREDGVDKGGHINTIRNSLTDAERIVFLGFGFNAQNMKLLFPEKLSKNVQLWGTMLLAPHEENAAQTLLRDATGETLQAHGSDCSTYFTSHGQWLMA